MSAPCKPVQIISLSSTIYPHFLVKPQKDMLFVNYEAPDGSKRHNRLWNGGNGWGTVKLYDKRDGQLELVDEVEAAHIGCEYGEYTE